jgi:hypothetical protein
MAERAVAAGRLYERLPFVHRQAVGETVRDVKRCRTVDGLPALGLAVEVAISKIALATD